MGSKSIRAWVEVFMVVVAVTLSGCACDPRLGDDKVTCRDTEDCFEQLGRTDFECHPGLRLCIQTGIAVDGGGGQPCTVAEDCPAFGPALCGAWECNAGECEVVCSDCTDLDRDGFGIGDGCAGLDCDDADDTVTRSGSTACYTGPVGTLTGACREGVLRCWDGVTTDQCAGEIVPVGEACNDIDDDCDGDTDEGLGSVSCGLGACAVTVDACKDGIPGACQAGSADLKSCNGEDDDCDGVTDEGCACVHASADVVVGDAQDGSEESPYRNIQDAIVEAEKRVLNGQPAQVCVAGGPDCNAQGVFYESLVMSNGIDVLGKFESTNWTRCDRLVTKIRNASIGGLLFPDSVVDPTVLDGFHVVRASNVLSTDPLTGILVKGPGAVINDVRVDDGLAALGQPPATSIGVRVLAPGSAIVQNSGIHAGAGWTAVAIQAEEGAVVTVRENCGGSTKQGVCRADCSANGNRGIYANSGPATAGQAYGVFLQGAAGSVVSANSICADEAVIVAAVRVSGNAERVVIRGNYASARGYERAHTLWLEDCSGASPRIVANTKLFAESQALGSESNGINVVGDCHPVIERNEVIEVFNPTNHDGEQAGILCRDNFEGIPARCFIVNNDTILGGSGFGGAPAGIRCEFGSCARIEGNENIVGGGGQRVVGIELRETGTFVDGNHVTGGCSQVASSGIHAVDSWARIQNNLIFAGTRPFDSVVGLAPDYRGLEVWTGSRFLDLDVHSNFIDGMGEDTDCSSAAIALRSSDASAPPTGLYRNNILRPGDCQKRFGVEEVNAGADPRRFWNNLIDTTLVSTVLYRDESGDLTTIDGVNNLAGTGSGMNLEGVPGFVLYPDDLRLVAGSVCIDAGTLRGAPRVGLDGVDRGSLPDIGPYEYVAP